MASVFTIIVTSPLTIMPSTFTTMNNEKVTSPNATWQTKSSWLQNLSITLQSQDHSITLQNDRRNTDLNFISRYLYSIACSKLMQVCYAVTMLFWVNLFSIQYSIPYCTLHVPPHVTLCRYRVHRHQDCSIYVRLLHSQDLQVIPHCSEGRLYNISLFHLNLNFTAQTHISTSN